MNMVRQIWSKYNFLLIITLLAVVWLAQFSAVMAAPPPQGQDIASITSPASNAVVQGQVQISGSADYPSFQFYILEFAPEPVSDNQWQIIGDIHQKPTLNSVLETWDTTKYPDGSYTIRLRVVRLDGNYSEFFVKQVVVSNARPIPTATPETQETPTPTITPTALPSTPTVVIEQPVVETPTPRPIETSAPLQNPAEQKSLLPSVSGFALSPLRDTCLYGAGLMLGLFLLFGFLAALRTFIQGFIDALRRYRRK
jgi:hypothetical protein